ncbi:MAG: bifunctional molybdenum cofactor biosynthesis protein MoaC/MoaB [Calditrichaceae bacterium]|nr:bifunctional molybdenum cofactor biosynthesis protein MoaC/MoaB [Calditrichia bacterium]NUQ40107.1 bifunctional molybdenum cofactor biosynthesis protein MoaC/MoaB [Calditrichaceae bacterium]
MIDVSPKFNTLRYAMAKGTLIAKAETIHRVIDRTVPKGDVLEVARAAGINAAKRCSDWMVFCHNLPLDWIDLKFEFEEDRIKVFAEAKAIWKTGVEMEALAAVAGALLNMYDMLKPLDEELAISDVKLVKKKGGKSSFRDGFAEPLRAAVLVISDSTFAGQREDKSGKIIQQFLEKQEVSVAVYEVLPDEKEQIRERLIQLADREKIDLLFTTGGTGLGPRDVTPEATREVIHKEIPGIAEALRKHGKERTPYAMLSREVSGLRGNCLIVNLPGSSKGAQESMEALFPGLLHAFPMMRGFGH